ncbi:uracil DNA glycosylase [Mayamaea pseudoterrestris]|nr:uracil DNA glycosylase [Mayamaea pseudoterrestris]
MITSYFKAKPKESSSKQDETVSGGVKRSVEDECDGMPSTVSTTHMNEAHMNASTTSVPPAAGKKRIKQSPAATINASPEASDSLFSYVTEPSWRAELDAHFLNNPSLQILSNYIAKERQQHIIFPPAHETFTALNLCPLHKIKVVIVGQDPYHGLHQAHGLAFSVGRTEKIPPSLRNIYKELLSDHQIDSMPQHGHLERWAKQGVLLLNATLTVRSGMPNSHAKVGWQLVTDRIIQRVASQANKRVVFMLWGKPAYETTVKALSSSKLLQSQHVMIRTSHPSPLGATKTDAPFMGSKCFRRCNEALVEMKHDPIDWNVNGALP